jgi:hypothetical protein
MIKFFNKEGFWEQTAIILSALSSVQNVAKIDTAKENQKSGEIRNQFSKSAPEFRRIFTRR